MDMDFLLPYLDDAFGRFYKDFLSDSHFSVFFEGDEKESIIRKQRKYIEDCFKGEDLDKSCRNLAELHYQIGVPYGDFSVGLDTLRDIFYGLVEEDSLKSSVVSFFEKIKNSAAKRFFELTLIEDENNIEKLLSEKTLSYEFGEEFFIRQHLLWFKGLVNSIKNEDISTYPDEDLGESGIKKWLGSENYENSLEKEEREFLLYLYKKVHRGSITLFYFLRHKLYHQALELYKEISKLSFILTDILVLLLSRVRSKESMKDPLTGLFTRRVLERVLESSIDTAIATEKSLCVVIADLDNFKSVNDNYGHLAGDLVLKGFSKILVENLRKSDFVFRYGGEEFLIVLPGATRDEAKAIMERIRERIECEVFSFKGNKIQITASFGISCFDPKKYRRRVTKEELVEEADINLYEAKRLGKNMVVG